MRDAARYEASYSMSRSADQSVVPVGRSKLAQRLGRQPSPRLRPKDGLKPRSPRTWGIKKPTRDALMRKQADIRSPRTRSRVSIAAAAARANDGFKTPHPPYLPTGALSPRPPEDASKVPFTALAHGSKQRFVQSHQALAANHATGHGAHAASPAVGLESQLPPGFFKEAPRVARISADEPGATSYDSGSRKRDSQESDRIQYNVSKTEVVGYRPSDWEKIPANEVPSYASLTPSWAFGVSYRRGAVAAAVAAAVAPR